MFRAQARVVTFHHTKQKSLDRTFGTMPHITADYEYEGIIPMWWWYVSIQLSKTPTLYPLFGLVGRHFHSSFRVPFDQCYFKS